MTTTAEKCKWSNDVEFDCWETQCGNAWTFIDGTPEDNEVKYCPYCGREIQPEITEP